MPNYPLTPDEVRAVCAKLGITAPPPLSKEDTRMLAAYKSEEGIQERRIKRRMKKKQPPQDLICQPPEQPLCSDQ